MKYVWMNEPDSVLAKEGSLVKVPYVEPSFWELLMPSQWFQGLMEYERIIWKMLYVICNMLCAMCKMLCVVCNMISMMMNVTPMSWLY